MGAMRSYRASDALMRHREAIEAHLFDRAMDLFDLAPTVTLYDLTNTFHEGEAADQPDARRGHSKEKRSDCPLLALGLVLDAGGFVRRSRPRTQKKPDGLAAYRPVARESRGVGQHAHLDT